MRRLSPAPAPRNTALRSRWGQGAKLALLVLAVGSLTACAFGDSNARSGTTKWYEPYRIEVVQGNVVTREMVEQLRNGYTRDQVRAVMGTPLLADIFHANRWDYAFSIKRQGAEPQQRTVTVYFDGDRMTRFEAGELPSEQEFVTAIDIKRAAKAPKLALSDSELQALAVPTVRAKPASESASGPVRAYPPLEPAAR